MLFFFLIIAAIFFLFYMYIEAHRNRVISAVVKVDKLPDSFNDFQIFFISDVHRRAIGDSILEVASGADVVIIGGDLAEKGVPMDRIKDNLIKLTKAGPVYLVWGNNDYELDMKQLMKTVEDCGVFLINNACITLKKNDESIDIVGVDDLSWRKDNIEQAVSTCTSSYRILISHNPAITKKMSKQYQLSLVLSGHTHGGQIRLGPIGIAKKGGWYDRGFYKLLISNGYGTRHLPLRFGAPSEANLITLKKAKSLQ